MAKDYQEADPVYWDRGSYYGTDWPEELALVVRDGGKDKVLIVCLDGQERWVKKENVRGA